MGSAYELAKKIERLYKTVESLQEQVLDVAGDLLAAMKQADGQAPSSPENGAEPVLVQRRASAWKQIFANKPEVMSGEAVARALGMKHGTFMSNWLRAGFPEPHHTGGRGRGRRHYWRRDDVVAWLEGYAARGEAPPVLPGFERRS